MGLKNNMLIAAEACFEMDPSPKNDAWVDRKMYQVCTKSDAKKCLVPSLYQGQNITKHNKTSQNKNSGKP